MLPAPRHTPSSTAGGRSASPARSDSEQWPVEKTARTLWQALTQRTSSSRRGCRRKAALGTGPLWRPEGGCMAGALQTVGAAGGKVLGPKGAWCRQGNGREAHVAGVETAVREAEREPGLAGPGAF